MQFPAVTAVYAGVLGLVLVILSIWVIAGRGQFHVNLGDGGNEALRRRVRAHANFTEYVPLILLLVALLEMQHTSRMVIHGLLLLLVVGRLLHPFGVMAEPGSTRQTAGRATGAVLTLGVLAVAAVLLLLGSL
jgi:uncharacterized protein